MTEPTPSRAAVMGHPIHPMLIPFPIALISAALVADVVYAVNDGEAWASAWATGAAWLLWGAVASGGLAALAGMVDFFGIEAVRKSSTAIRHAVGNGLVLALTLVNGLLRLGDPQGAVLPLGIVLTAAASLVMVYTGWLGGELSYRHMIGVDPHMHEPSRPAVGRSKEGIR